MTRAAEAPEVGESRTMVVADNITRTQIVMYAGASGDYNPLHSDEIYSTAVAGYPSVFAHGMLSMGASGRLLTDWFGVESLVRYGVRFVKQVWPGDSLSATATVTAVREDKEAALVDLAIETVNQDGAVVVAGTATARID